MLKERKNLRKVIAVAICLAASATMFAQETGVVINGVTWANRNVDASGTFVANTKDAGMFYQWNSKIGWSSTDPLVSTNGSTWNSSWDGNGATTWGTANDPSPAGWHVPTQADFEKLLDATKVDYAWTTVNGVVGGLFTDKTNYNSIFLPAAGTFDENIGLVNIGINGLYWSSTENNSDAAGYFYFNNTTAIVSSYGNKASALNVRSVKGNSTGINAVSVDTENAKITGYFDILGRKLTEEPTKGIYIIKYDNGKTKKMMK